MTDESPDVTPDDDRLRALLDRPLMTPDELTALWRNNSSLLLEVAAPLLAATATTYLHAFLATLAQHDAEGLRAAVRTRFRKHGKTREALVGLEDGSAAEVVITNDLPDEARLALLDLDVTADDVRGRTLRWDEDAMAWRPDPKQTAPDKTAG